MAGHSKWANIKHKKAAQDAKKSKNFQKISKEIQIAIKNGGNDPETNQKLKVAIEKAKANNIPNDNIKKLLEKGNKDSSQLTETRYEGYGINGIAVIVETLTDNINRTSGFVKSTFNKFGGNLGTSGSVSFLFENVGIIVIEDTSKIEEIMMLDNIIDIIEEDNLLIIKITNGHLIEIKEKLNELGINEFLEFSEGLQPIESVELDDSSKEKIFKMIDHFEESDDIVEIITNMK